MQFVNVAILLKFSVNEVEYTVQPGVYVSSYSQTCHSEQCQETRPLSNMIPDMKVIKYTTEDQERFWGDAKKLFHTMPKVPRNVLWKIMYHRSDICASIISQEWLHVSALIFHLSSYLNVFAAAGTT
jgi:hypothetical protein